MDYKKVKRICVSFSSGLEQDFEDCGFVQSGNDLFIDVDGVKVTVYICKVDMISVVGYEDDAQ